MIIGETDACISTVEKPWYICMRYIYAVIITHICEETYVSKTLTTGDLSVMKYATIFGHIPIKKNQD